MSGARFTPGLAWTRGIALLALAVLLAGCAPTRRQVIHANYLVRTQASQAIDCHAPHACAADSALLELGTDDPPERPVNHAIILELGEDALIARLNLIRAARERISIQTFIWAEDDSGQLVLDELVRAARRGVEVQVLADQLASFTDVGLLARLARTHVNFQLRLYNPTLHTAATVPVDYVLGGLCCFSRFNQRMHNKLLLVDDRVGITGGRNYEDKYFDWDPAFNFLDRDVLVAGPVAAEMRRSFDEFWRHPRTVELAALSDVGRRLVADGEAAPVWETPAWKNPARVARVLSEAADPAYIDSHFLQRTHRLAEAHYFSDRPGKREVQDEVEREFTARLMHLLANAEQEIVLQTPYLVISKHAQKIFRKLASERPQVRITVSTNSLAATDAFAVYALSHKYVRRHLAVFNFHIYEQKPHPLDAPRMIASGDSLAGAHDPGGRRGRDRVPLTTAGMRLSLHAKSMVIDDEFVMIGSHNFDPRSDDYNTESGLVINDAAFATVVRAAILANIRPGNSWVIARRRADGLTGRVNRVLAKFSARLPIFDLWPFGYATSWELKPGCAPVPRDDPGFHECYEPVGEFPEVDLPLKTIYTRIIRGFGSGIGGLL